MHLSAITVMAVQDHPSFPLQGTNRVRLKCRATLFFKLVVCLGTFVVFATASNGPNDEATTGTPRERIKHHVGASNDPINPERDSNRQMAMRELWTMTLEEIRNLVAVPKPLQHQQKANTNKTSTSTLPLLQRWKLLARQLQIKNGTVLTSAATTTTTQREGEEEAIVRPNTQVDRFDGFIDWEKKLQQWADDVSDYLSPITTTTEGGDADDNQNALEYPLSRYGVPRSSSSSSSARSDGRVPGRSRADSNSIKSTNNDQIPTQDDENKTNNLKDDGLAKQLTNDLRSRNRIIDNKKDIVATAVGVAAAAVVEKQRRKTKMKELFTLPELNFPIIPEPARPGEPVLPETDISDKSKRIWVVTTATLPWMTGTAVNPLLRSAYLTRGRGKAGGSVTLLIPWLERKKDQARVYGAARQFETQQEQEEYIRSWLREAAGMKDEEKDLRIQWYTAWQEPAENSLYAMGDITALIPEEEADICILEEPEHLNWYRAPGENWTNKFKHVVGIVHTNYFVYAQESSGAFLRAPAMRLLCSWMCRAHCHRIIKLSGTLGNFAPEKELIENVHGVRSAFLDAGKEVKRKLSRNKNDPIFGSKAPPSIYFIGKMLWAKGLSSLMELVKYAEESAGLQIKVDMYGDGPEKEEAEAKSIRLGLDMPFHGRLDHAELAMTHKIFVNPSISEVLCTTTAEALAMGKFAIIPSHPSNDFFAQFPNCLPYSSKEEFVGNLYYAVTHSPEPMSEEFTYAFSWEAATERFEAAASIPVAEAEAMAEALSGPQPGYEMDLPPLIEDEKRRRKIEATIRLTRDRYRQFRSRLSDELQSQKFLPPDLKKKVISELDKRLDLDIGQVLGSPKLRLKLSPAELDRQLLELYASISSGSGGDIVRLIGGGTNVGMQNLYLKKQARQMRKKGGYMSWSYMEGPPDVVSPTLQFLSSQDDASMSNDTTITGRIRKSLRRNLSAHRKAVARSSNNSQLEREERIKMPGTPTVPRDGKNGPQMSLTIRPGAHASGGPTGVETALMCVRSRSFVQPRHWNSGSLRAKLLI